MIDRRVMIVDDDKDIRDILAEVLEHEGCIVEQASDGALALRALEAGARPDLILLDMMMPVMDGSQFRSAQLADSRLAAIPVVILTASADAKEAGARCRAAASFVKPVRLQELLAAISGILRPAP